jgi:hypothetical protein
LRDFQITRNGEPIQEIELKARLNAGIDIEGIPGLIPRFHEKEACDLANYQFFNSWRELEPEEREEIVAHYIARNLVESHKDDALNQKIERDRKQKPRTKG